SEPVVESESTATSKYTFGGYVEANANISDYGSGDLAPASAGTQFYIPATIPVGGEGEGPDTDLESLETRIFFRHDRTTEAGDSLTGYLELDFFLSVGGNERVSNSFAPRIRHGYIKYNNWLFGQTWTTFQDVAALPENVDFVGPAEGTAFGRQTMVRYTRGPWEFAVENPETTITPFGGGPRIVTDDGAIPDLVARYTHQLDNGYLKVAGLVRELNYDFGGPSDTEIAYALSVSGKHMFGSDDLRWMATAGPGVGRYLGLNTSNGAVLDADGNLEAIDQFGAFASYRHFWREGVRSNLTLSYLDIDNDTALTGSAVTRSVYSVHANLLYDLMPRLTVGGEIMYAQREIETGQEGDLTRLLLTAKYGF
ncbi:MAG: DcaP family trimeric outer membrane transporter, partial [Pseudomonadota bacterium]